MDGVQLRCNNNNNNNNNNDDDDDDDDDDDNNNNNNNKPDIIIHNNKIGTCMLKDVANPGDRNVIKREAEKVL
jgi:hypothetical protein